MNAPVASTNPAVSAPATEKYGSDDHVLRSPAWVLVVRGFQILLSFIIVAMAGKLIHDAYLDENGLAVAISVFTWVFVGYILVAELVGSCRRAYHILAVIILDGLMVILWLATWAAVAARRAQFTTPVDVNSCSDDGSLISSKTCWRKRELAKRAVLLFKLGANLMAAVAGVGALVWLLFIATFVWTIMQFVKGRKEGRFPISSTGTTTGPVEPTGETYQMEPKPVDPSQQPMMQNQPPQGHYPPPAGTYPQAPYQSAVSPPAAQGPYPPPMGAGYPQDQQMHSQYPQQQQQQQQQPYQQQTYAQEPYPQQQYQYQPPTSPSPVTMPSQSPPPQELAPQPYSERPQEMPATQYHVPENRA